MAVSFFGPTVSQRLTSKVSSSKPAGTGSFFNQPSALQVITAAVNKARGTDALGQPVSYVGSAGQPVSLISGGAASYGGGTPSQPSTPQEFLQAGNIVTAAARGETGTAQELFEQASPEVQDIVVEQARQTSPVIGAQASFEAPLNTPQPIEVDTRNFKTTLASRGFASKEVSTLSDQSKTMILKAEEKATEAERIQEQYFSGFKTKYGVSTPEEFRQKINQTSINFPIAANKMIAEYNAFAKDYSKPIIQAQSYYGIGSSSSMRAENIAKEYFGPTYPVGFQKPVVFQPPLGSYITTTSGFNGTSSKATVQNIVGKTQGSVFGQISIPLAEKVRATKEQALSLIPPISKPTEVIVPKSWFSQTPFGLESSQVKRAAKNIFEVVKVDAQPGTELRKYQELQARESKLMQDISLGKPYYESEAERINVFGQIPMLSTESQKELKERAQRLATTIDVASTEAAALKTGFETYKPYSATPGRKKLLLETAPWQIPSEGLAYGGGWLAETFLPEKKGPDIYFDWLGEKRKVSIGSKEEVKGMLQRAGQVTGELALTAAAFKAAGLIMPKPPTINITNAEARLIVSPKGEKTLLTLTGKATPQSKGLQRLLYSKTPKKFKVVASEETFAKSARLADEISPFSLRLSTTESPIKSVQELVTKGITGKGTKVSGGIMFEGTASQEGAIKQFLKTELLTGKVGKETFFQSGFPIETSIKAKTIISKTGQKNWTQYIAKITGETQAPAKTSYLTKAWEKIIGIKPSEAKTISTPYTGLVWQKVLMKTAEPAKTGLKAAGIGRVGGVFESGGQKIILGSTGVEIRQLAKPTTVMKLFGKAKPSSSLTELFGKESLLPQYSLPKKIVREVELRGGLKGMVTTVTEPFSFAAQDFVQSLTTPAVVKAVSGIKPTTVTFVPSTVTATLAPSTNYIPGSYSAIAIALPRVLKTPTERMFEQEMLEVYTIPKTKLAKVLSPGKTKQDKLFDEIRKMGDLEDKRFSNLQGESTTVNPLLKVTQTGPVLKSSIDTKITPALKQFLGETEVQKGRRMQKENVNMKTMLSQVMGLTSKQKFVSGTKTGQSTKAAEQFKLAERMQVTQKILSGQAQKDLQRIAEKMHVAQHQKTRVAEMVSIAPFTFKPITPFFLFPQKRIPKPTGKQFGFQVLVRTPGKKVKGKHVPGKFEPLTQFVLPRAQALALGQSKVMAAAKRSFKIAPAFGQLAFFKGRAFKPQEFTRKGRTFVEKTKYAIDTPGELLEITRKGRKAAKNYLIGKRPKKRKLIKKKKE